MKKIILFSLVAAFAIMGCKKDEDSKPSYNGEVTISGVKTSFTEMMFWEWGTNSMEIDNNGENDQNSLEIWLESPALGEVDFNIDNSIRIEIGTKVYNSQTGKITLTKIDDSTVIGSFSGTFTDEADAEIQISGSFTSKPYSFDLGDI